MSGKVLGRVVASTDQPRGPDAQMSIAVPESWISEGATMEIELPRNLACASCGGGGCDACGRAGGVSLRGRADPKETVEVTLPKAKATTQARAIVLRIPQKGGTAAEGSELPRGNLLLTVNPGEDVAAGVKRLPRPSVPAPPITPELVAVQPARRGGDAGVVWLLVAAVLSALAAWLLQR